MAHLQTPPRQSSSSRVKPFGLVTPSTPRRTSPRYTNQLQCPDAPFLPANFLARPIARPSPPSERGDPTKPQDHVRTRTSTGDPGTLLHPGMPPTPAETPVQKRRREQEMKLRIQAGNDTTGRRLFPPKLTTPAPLSMDTTTPFDIFTDSMHQTPVSSPTNPFSIGNMDAHVRGLSPRKRKRTPAARPDEMAYTFRGQRFMRKMPKGPSGEPWRETVRPVRLFQKEIEKEDGRRRKRRRLATEEVEEVDTEEERGSDDNNNGITC